MNRLHALTDVPSGILTVSEMRAAEARAIANCTPGIALMERAGAAVVDVISNCYGGLRRAAVICGPGNNGGDGFVIARGLEQRGVTTTVYALVPLEALTGDAAIAAQRWCGSCLTFSAVCALDQVDIVVDALFGVGINRPIVGPAAAAISGMNAAFASGTAVVSVDIPSGIDGDTGLIHGAAVNASSTVTFHRLKRGHVLEPGRSHAGSGPSGVGERRVLLMSAVRAARQRRARSLRLA